MSICDAGDYTYGHVRGHRGDYVVVLLMMTLVCVMVVLWVGCVCSVVVVMVVVVDIVYGCVWCGWCGGGDGMCNCDGDNVYCVGCCDICGSSCCCHDECGGCVVVGMAMVGLIAYVGS